MKLYTQLFFGFIDSQSFLKREPKDVKKISFVFTNTSIALNILTIINIISDLAFKYSILYELQIGALAICFVVFLIISNVNNSLKSNEMPANYVYNSKRFIAIIAYLIVTILAFNLFVFQHSL
ncbi:MAG: hypothetical protein CVU05_10605 [Bacteroidetes bacterium HGW-Bacteroidetes-21]|jgi:hypothetical protein|nr:MAG: hypothetical protein CVU05_10605 [Bacteroidetes bacterium HGW-Bacteroidetes-21]